MPLFCRSMLCSCAVVSAVLCGLQARAQAGSEVTLRLTVRDASGRRSEPTAASPVVVWLSPVGTNSAADTGVEPGLGKSFQMVQKDKMFSPHLLVVPVGGVVAFPNRDPFFHNVFSLFNGRRFDLGLYETGNSHSVPFHREGISYIFCNIHPEMGAVIVSVATPYFAVAREGVVHLYHVLAGEYLLKVWAEDATEASLRQVSRTLHVDGAQYDGGDAEISLEVKQPHTNKFGKPYTPQREQNSHY